MGGGMRPGVGDGPGGGMGLGGSCEDFSGFADFGDGGGAEAASAPTEPTSTVGGAMPSLVDWAMGAGGTGSCDDFGGFATAEPEATPVMDGESEACTSLPPPAGIGALDRALGSVSFLDDELENARRERERVQQELDELSAFDEAPFAAEPTTEPFPSSDYSTPLDGGGDDDFAAFESSETQTAAAMPVTATEAWAEESRGPSADFEAISDDEFNALFGR